MKNRTALLNTLLVFKGEKLVGRGWFIIYDGMNFAPVITSEGGGELEPDWYKLVVLDQYITVLSEMIQ